MVLQIGGQLRLSAVEGAQQAAVGIAQLALDEPAHATAAAT